MKRLLLDHKINSPLNILCLGAHADDIEIGCGGTILSLLEKYKSINLTWSVFSADSNRAQEAKKSAKKFLKQAIKSEIIINNFRDGYFPYDGAVIKDSFEILKKQINPDLIFTHYKNDAHQDHRLLCDLTWNTFRNHMILEYEIPKFDGDLGQPNFFVPIPERLLKRKIQYMLDCFQTQKNRHWFCEETFRSLPRLRGMEAALRTKYAEAFYCRKLIMG